MYIDDLIRLAINLPDTNNIQQAKRAHLLAIHACCRPVHNVKPIPRHPMVSKRKLEAEAALAKLQTIIGWYWDLHCLIILLPTNIFFALTKIIEDTIAIGYINAKEFESIIGRLNHLALVFSLVIHFLSCHQELLLKATKSSRQQAKVTPKCSDDLHLMVFFIKKSTQRNKFKPDCSLQTYTCVPLGFMPSRFRRIQSQGFCVALQNSLPSSIPCVKQPFRESGGGNHTMGGYHCRSSEKGRLCLIDDRQHNK